MTQNPYAEGGADIFPETERTSIMAILSLVCSLICCIPGLGLLGTMLGVFSLIGIGGSRGRVGGKGLAIAGIILGLLVTIIWVGIVIGLGMVGGQMDKMASPVFRHIEADEFDEARLVLISPAADLTDAEFIAFRTAYHDSMGVYIGVPTNLIKFFSAYANPDVGPQMQSHQGPGVLPVPAEFDNGLALLALEFDPQNPGTNASGGPAFDDLVIVLSDGTEIRLTDFASGLAPIPPDPTPEIAPEVEPEPEPAPDEAP